MKKKAKPRISLPKRKPKKRLTTDEVGPPIDEGLTIPCPVGGDGEWHVRVKKQNGTCTINLVAV